MLAPAIAAGEIIFHRFFDAETTDDAGFGLSVLVDLLDLSGEAGKVGGKSWRGVPAFD